MKSPNKILGPFFIALLAVYSNQANLVEGATPNDQPADTKPAGHPGINLTDSQVGVADDGGIEIHATSTPVQQLLRTLSQKTGKNIIAGSGVTGDVTADIYKLNLNEALDAILQPNGYVFRQSGNVIFVYTRKELAELDKATRNPSTRVFRLYYTPAADAMAMIKPVLTADGTVQASTAASKGINTSGGASSSGSSGAGGSDDTGGNSYAGGDLLVVTDDTAKLGEIAELLKQIDHRPQQVLIEATIMAATLTDNTSLGVDFSVMGGVKFGNFLQAPATTIQNAVSGTLVNTATGASAHNYGIGSTSFPNPTPGGLNIGFLSNNVSVFVNALESINNTTILANPKILALDRQQAEVHVGNIDYYQNSTTATQTASIQSAQEFDTGTILSVRPFVGGDGFIRMEIHPSDSVGGIVNNLPHSSTTEVTSNVMVKDGHTVVIGGLFRDESERSRSQVPGLGSIPFLGVLFRQQADQSKRQEIIILITPHLIQDESAYAQLSDIEMKHAEDLRVGVRKGMMFFGRERLAESAYENAIGEMNKPRPDRNLAIWHLNVAINLNPTFLEAIELKEKLSGKRVTDVDNSTIRDFVSHSILNGGSDPLLQTGK